jgi:hypothetical protein
MLTHRLADATCRCFDNSPASMGDAGSFAASAMDLGGADPKKFAGSMAFLPMVGGKDEALYYVPGPVSINVGRGPHWIAIKRPAPIKSLVVSGSGYSDIDGWYRLSVGRSCSNGPVWMMPTDNDKPTFLYCLSASSLHSATNKCVVSFAACSHRGYFYAPNCVTPEQCSNKWLALNASQHAGTNRWEKTPAFSVTRHEWSDETFGIDKLLVDSGNSGTLALPAPLVVSIGRAIVDWIQSHVSPGPPTHSSAAGILAGLLFDTRTTVTHDCVRKSSRAARIFRSVDFTREFPVVQLKFMTDENPLFVDLPPSSYLNVNNAYFICHNFKPHTTLHGQFSGVLGANVIRQYYTLFDRESLRIGLAKRGNCAPKIPVADRARHHSVYLHCAARRTCAECAGPVDDLEPYRGYCIWCPTTRTCEASDPQSVVSPCEQSQGFNHYLLDMGGTCAELTEQERICQMRYTNLTRHALQGGSRRTCAVQEILDHFAKTCASTKIRMHVNGSTRTMMGAACVLASANFGMQTAPQGVGSSIGGISRCHFDEVVPISCVSGEVIDHCAYTNDGNCDLPPVCPRGTDRVDCAQHDSTNNSGNGNENEAEVRKAIFSATGIIALLMLLHQGVRRRKRVQIGDAQITVATTLNPGAGMEL